MAFLITANSILNISKNQLYVKVFLTHQISLHQGRALTALALEIFPLDN